MNKPVAESCLQNQQVILEQLQQLFTEPGEVLEIGSGTGQHAVYFSEHMPHLNWQPSDLEDQHAGMKMWLDEVSHQRIKGPLVIDVEQGPWELEPVEYAFTANTTHIVSQPQAEKMIKHVAASLKPGGLFAQYGPFNYNGEYTAESNAQFDQWLKQRDPLSGIKHFENLLQWSLQNQMSLYKDIEMPVNNRILVWQKN